MDKRIALISGGVVDRVAITDLETAQQLGFETVVDVEGLDVGPGDLYDGVLFTRPPRPIEAPAAKVWTPLEFKRDLTPAERIAIRARAATDPVVFDFLDLLDSAQEVRSDDPDLIAGLNYLESVGDLAPGRAAEIVGGA